MKLLAKGIIGFWVAAVIASILLDVYRADGLIGLASFTIFSIVFFGSIIYAANILFRD